MSRRLRALAPLLAGIAAAGLPATAAAATIDRPFLWRVDSGAAPSHLFGTVHAEVAAEELPEAVGAALDESGLFVMETDPAAVDRQRLWAHGTAPPPHDLGELLGSDHWPALLAALGDPAPQDVRRLMPWLAATLVMQRSASTAEPIDATLATRARAAGLRIAILESPGFQLATLARTTDVSDLRELLEDSPEGAVDLTACYRRGDLDALHAATSPPATTPERYDLLFTQRNQRWAHLLQPALARGGVFVAVGAGHYPGAQGLLSLLRTHGHTIERIG